VLSRCNQYIVVVSKYNASLRKVSWSPCGLQRADISGGEYPWITEPPNRPVDIHETLRQNQTQKAIELQIGPLKSTAGQFEDISMTDLMRTPFCPLLIHDTMPTLSTTYRFPWFDFILRATIWGS
jgi:hypothetical protein